MQKNRKIILILVLAFIVAVIGGVALYFYLTPQKTTVYTFKENYSAGTAITQDMLTPVQADANIYYGGAKSDISSYYVTGDNISEVLKSGDSLRTDVVKGMPFTISLLTAGGGSKVEMQMDPTKIAITVPITNITGVTNELKSGSRVNVYVTGEGGGDSEVYSTKLIFQNMRVLSVSYAQGNTLESATLECNIEQSMELVYYASTYSIYLGLIDGTGYQATSVSNPFYAPSTGAITGNATDYDMEEFKEESEDSSDKNGKSEEVTTEESTEKKESSTEEKTTESNTER